MIEQIVSLIKFILIIVIIYHIYHLLSLCNSLDKTVTDVNNKLDRLLDLRLGTGSRSRTEIGIGNVMG